MKSHSFGECRGVVWCGVSPWFSQSIVVRIALKLVCWIFYARRSPASATNDNDTYTHTTHTRIHRWFVETVEDQQRTMHCNALIRPRSVAMNHRRVERVHRKSSIIHIHTHTAHTVERRKNNMPRQRSSSFNHEYIYLYHISQFLLLYQPDF